MLTLEPRVSSRLIFMAAVATTVIGTGYFQTERFLQILKTDGNFSGCACGSLEGRSPYFSHLITQPSHTAPINSVQNGMLLSACMHGDFENFLVPVNPDVSDCTKSLASY